MTRIVSEWDFRTLYKAGDRVLCHVDGSDRVYVALQDNLCSPPPNAISPWRDVTLGEGCADAT